MFTSFICYMIADDLMLYCIFLQKEIKPNLEELALDTYGRKVLMYLLCPRCPGHFHPSVVELLEKGGENTNRFGKNIIYVYGGFCPFTVISFYNYYYLHFLVYQIIQITFKFVELHYTIRVQCVLNNACTAGFYPQIKKRKSQCIAVENKQYCSTVLSFSKIS